METYDLQLDLAINKIQKTSSKLVCLQLPDGLKPLANHLESEISSRTGARVLIWLGSNFGACDVPAGLPAMGVDLLISWGHNQFHKKKEGW